jgi:hypothetical protein
MGQGKGRAVRPLCPKLLEKSFGGGTVRIGAMLRFEGMPISITAWTFADVAASISFSSWNGRQFRLLFHGDEQFQSRPQIVGAI